MASSDPNRTITEDELAERVALWSATGAVVLIVTPTLTIAGQRGAHSLIAMADFIAEAREGGRYQILKSREGQ